MKKKFLSIIAIGIAAMVILVSPMSAFAEEGRYDAEYVLLGLNVYVDMGVYDPGSYIISSSDLSDAGSNILDSMKDICKLPII